MLFDRRCPVCGEPHRTVCVRCVDRLSLAPAADPYWADHLTQLFVYDDAAARVVLAAKNGGRRDLLRWAGRLLAARIPVDSPIDGITWVPAHPDQRRVRGYDQGELLARAIGKRLGVRVRPLLLRRGGATRKGLDRLDRLAGPDVSARRAVNGHVLLIDDVIATGSSLRRSADALRNAGASSVSAAVVAASPSKSGALPAPLGSTIYIG